MKGGNEGEGTTGDKREEKRRNTARAGLDFDHFNGDVVLHNSNGPLHIQFDFILLLFTCIERQKAKSHGFAGLQIRLAVKEISL